VIFKLASTVTVQPAKKPSATFSPM